MKIEDEVKKIIISRYGSLRQFAFEIDIPYTTAQSIFSRGLDKAGIQNVIKICQAIGIDTDALADGKIEERKTNDSAVTVSEKEVLKKYRHLDTYGKKAVDHILNDEYIRVTEQSIQVEEPSTPYLYTKTEYLTGLSAGTGLFVFDDIPTSVINVPEEYKDADFVIGVSGDSMEPTYKDGDKVAVIKKPCIDKGDIGVFMINGNGYIKELGHNKLISHNKAYTDIDIDQTTVCIGKVLGKIKEI